MDIGIIKASIKVGLDYLNKKYSYILDGYDLNNGYECRIEIVDEVPHYIYRLDFDFPKHPRLMKDFERVVESNGRIDGINITIKEPPQDFE